MKFCILLTVLTFSTLFAVGQMPGWPVTIPVSEGIFLSSPLLVDIDCDEIKEVVLAGPDDSLRVFKLDGSYFPGFPIKLTGQIVSPVAIGPLTGTWFQFVVVTKAGVVHAIERNGTELAGFPVDLGASAGPAGVALWDFDRDGTAEIVAQAGENLYVLRSDGTLFSGFPVPVASEYGPAASPAVGDFTGDGSAEIVAVGYNKLFVYNSSGVLLPLFPIELGDSAGFSYSSPILLDFDGDDTLEIVCGYHSFTGTNRGYIGAWDIGATMLSSWPIATAGYGSWVYSSPAAGDIDGDGLPEIIATSYNGRGYIVNADATAHDPWSMSLGIGSLESSPIVCDLDGDGGPDIIFLGNDTLGSIAAYNAIGTAIDSFPITANSQWRLATPSIEDMDKDGDLELCAVGIDGKIHLFNYISAGKSYSRPWLMGKHDPLRTGWLHPKAPAEIEAFYYGDSVLVRWQSTGEWDFFGYRLYTTADSVDSSGGYLLGEFVDTAVVVRYDSIYAHFFVTAITRFTETERSAITGIDSLATISENYTPSDYVLKIYPNPFNAMCHIEADTDIEIFDLTGRMVANLDCKADRAVTWNALDESGDQLPSGVYLVRTRGSVYAKRIILLR